MDGAIVSTIGLATPDKNLFGCPALQLVARFSVENPKTRVDLFLKEPRD
jgi:hypothetical protein